MRLVRTTTAFALPLLLAAAAALLAAPAVAQHQGMVMSGKTDYDPDPGGGDHDPPEGCSGVTNKVTINGSAQAFSPATITISPGQPVCWTWNTGSISHNIKSDDGSFTAGQPASSNTFQRTFTTPGTYGYYCQVHGSPTGGMRGTVIVQDDGNPGSGESGPGTLSIDPGAYTVDEGGVASITVTRTGGTDGKVTVKIATGTGSASKGKDFLPKTAVLTWNSGDGDARTLAVTTKQDTAIEADETFPVTLSKVTGGAALGTTSATVTIHDDDGCPSALAAPSGLKANGQSGREIHLSWAPDPMLTKSVHVERRGDDGGSFREIAAVPAGRGDYVDAELPSGAAFQYRLRAESDAGLSDYSDIAAAATDGTIGACAGGARSLCLGDGRFEATVKFRRADGEPQRSALRAEASAAARSGLFSFAPGDDAQLMLKVTNGCAENGHFWVQLAAVSDAELFVSVRDTQTGRTWAFYNPAGKVAGAVRDVDAFGTCP